MAERKRIKERDQQQQNYYNSLSPNVQGFLNEFQETFGFIPDITSGQRSGNEKSWHFHGDAVDLRSKGYLTENGTSVNPGQNMFNLLMNTQQGLRLLVKYDLGILDETDPHTLMKTKGSAPHFHIGKDGVYANMAKERLSMFNNEGVPTENFKAVMPYNYIFNSEFKSKYDEDVQNKFYTQTQILNPNFIYSTETDSLANELWDDSIAIQEGLSQVQDVDMDSYRIQPQQKIDEEAIGKAIAEAMMSQQRAQDEERAKLEQESAEAKAYEFKLKSVLSAFEEEELSAAEEYNKTKRERMEQSQPVSYAPEMMIQQINPNLGNINIG